MPITVQQFDFLAETMGIAVALAEAEKAGGVTGTRDQPTQMVLPGEGVETPTGMTPGAWGGSLTTGGGYMPGTLATDVSRGIGEAGTAASGGLDLSSRWPTGLLSGGGGVLSAGQELTLADLMALGEAADTSGNLPNAPLGGVTSLAPVLATAAEALMARANAGEILSVSEIASLERSDQRAIAQVVLGNFISHMQQMGQDGDIEGVNNSFYQIYELWQNFYEAGEEIDVLMKSIATERGVPGFFDGYEEALRSRGESLGGQMPTGTGAGSFQFKKAAGPLQGTDKEIFDFLAGFAKKHFDLGTSSDQLLTAMLNEGADWMISEPGLFGQTFTDRTDAYRFLADWAYKPTGGNFGSLEGWGIFNDAAMAMPAWTGGPSATAAPAAQVTPTVSGQPAPVTGGFDPGGLGEYFGGAESLRPFGQIYPGFTSLIPGATTSPAVASAYAQAEAPLELQYLARKAMTPWGGGAPTAAETGSDIKTWLQNVQAGTQPLMMGQDYAGFLNQLSGALGSELGALPSYGGQQMEQGRYDKLRGLFRDPAAQLSAFMNPFYGATSGAPAVRQAMINQINEAARRYQYQEPTGSFLPWAIEQNIGGIQGILPSLQGWAPPA